MAKIAQKTIGNFGQGVIQLAVGVRKFFAPLIISILLIIFTLMNAFAADSTLTGGAVKLAKCAKSFAF
ncbi:Uncharacterised protein [Salmonella enterica subsp. arizonae]|uniref:Uncharacterized protein n=1 Tax=Salmonella enterica subsp. arizonae TaxID=59203 RepID=A0A2X4WBB5_SALER|nr:Uncharacterised protein [Salmonella enterica subsp. arizonae]